MLRKLTSLRYPATRRHVLTMTSAGLIAAALFTLWVLDRPAITDGLMITAALLAGFDIAVRALRSLLRRQISIELLVTVATAGALIIGEYWEAAAVTFLFTFGAYLEARAFDRTRSALRELIELAPDTAIVLRDGQQIEVSAAEVAPGETVLIKPGSKIPVDGRILDGLSTIDESAITGESVPVEKYPGAQVFAGTVNQGGLLRVEATGVGVDTTLARIIHRVEEAQEERAPAQRFIERFARWYTPAIIGLSAGVLALTSNVEMALTLLVIGCPGALVISTPVSIVAGIGRAARRGILIKGGEYLENAGKLTALALDKTGTLTHGRPRLVEVVSLEPARVAAVASGGTATATRTPTIANGSSWDSDQLEILRWAAIAEAGSEHPLAGPIVEAAAQFGPVPQADQFESVTGRGVMASYQGRMISVGTEALIAGPNGALDNEVLRNLDRMREQGMTAVIVAVDGEPRGILGIADTLRDSASALVERLEQIGIGRIVMLTGDNRLAARAIARQAGITEVRAELLPDAKLSALRELQAEGYTVGMVGDGINDAPALAAADVGFAMGVAGTAVAIETAPVALLSDNLMKIPEAISISRATLRNIRQNIAIAMITVVGLLGGVLLDEIHLAGGMFIHQISVLVVILNGLRLARD